MGKALERAIERKRRMKKPVKKQAGGNLKEVPADNKGLSKLPTKVRNKMGYRQGGGSMKEASTRGTPAQGQRAFESEKAQMEDFKKHMAFIESQLSDNRGGKKKVNKKTGSRVNEAGNYTKPGMRKRLFESIKAGGKGGKPGQWSARKAQMLAKRYKEKGGGYKS